MKFWRRNWYYIGGILFVLLSFFMGLWGCNHMSRIRVILIFSFFTGLSNATALCMMLICIVLTETPLKKWVYKQDQGVFAFEDAKYYEKYPSFWKK